MHDFCIMNQVDVQVTICGECEYVWFLFLCWEKLWGVLDKFAVVGRKGKGGREGVGRKRFFFFFGLGVVENEAN